MDENERLHRDWIGMAQPSEGLVVSRSALKAAEANVTQPILNLQASLKDLAGEAKVVLDLPRFFKDILDWSSEFVVDREHLPETLSVQLDGGGVLTPHFAVRSADEDGKFVLLVGLPEKLGGDLDAATDDKRWTATPQQRFARLLRDTGVHVGLLTNGTVFRLVYAPHRESAGWVNFRVADMLSVDGRPLLGALHMLLNERRLLSLEPEKRLLGLLKASREYQNTVSNALREQFLAALRELLRGFEHADQVSKGTILGEVRREHLQEVYVALVTVLMRMVFTVYAEERGLLPMENELYASSYSLTRLHAQLVDEHGRFGNGLEDRYGAWARVITLFRLLHDGVKAADGLVLPARRGDFFNPNAFPFLEGRPRGSSRQIGETLDVPRISDGVVFRVLDRLLVLGGERLQYKGLDVEQIGSVYEGLMGFAVEVAQGDSLAFPYTIKGRSHTDVVVDLSVLVREPASDRAKKLKALAGFDLNDKIGTEVKAAKTTADLHAALARKISSRQPGLIPAGALYLQPGEERRKSGSHYTPKSLTAPIVETTLRPILERLGPDITPEQILGLKICDPAMGSAAFLVEACRQLADLLVAAWRRTNSMPDLPLDEDPVLHAARLIAQRCLYGVDKNPLAVDLARLSMWLVTFAKEHPFTFVDHALRCGDSLVGLSKEQISSLSPDLSKGKQLDTVRQAVLPAMTRAEDLRRQIHAIGDPPNIDQLVGLWKDANEALHTVRMLGDLVVAAFFSADSDKARKKSFADLSGKVSAWLATGTYEADLKGMVADLRGGEKPVTPFHWEIEFPEVFSRENPGFDCFVGNPPFLGGTRISTVLGMKYFAHLTTNFVPAGHHCDLVAYFFRAAFNLLRSDGTFGLLATKTIAQGDSRSGGLGWICRHGGTIYAARRRFRWPGLAKVRVSVVHVSKGTMSGPFVLDTHIVPCITAYLFHRGGSDEPARLEGRNDLFSIGSKIYGQGFLFADDEDKATKVAELEHLKARNAAIADRVLPYLGGVELNTNPTHSSYRYVIDVNAFEEEEIRRRWPELLDIIERKVKPERDALGPNPNNVPLRRRWWAYQAHRPDLYRALAPLHRTLVCTQTSKFRTFTFVSSKLVFDQKLVVIALDDAPSFAVLHSRLHEDWALFFGSTMKDDPVYTPSDCFETFPFPSKYGVDRDLERLGTNYYEYRAALMVTNDQGLTDTYNRFHDREEDSPDIVKLRELHARMDRAVLDAYGWSDIKPVYEFHEQIDDSVRFTWADETRDEVLARLLELNRVRAEEESKAAPKVEAKAPRKTAKKKGKADETTEKLFGGDDG